MFFDDLKVSQTGTQVLAKTDYYPFGMVNEGLSYTAPSISKNNYLFQGKEYQEELGLDIYDFEARGYDAITGRTLQQDPHSENYFSLSSYSFFANNPLLFVDPNGKDIAFYVWEQKGDEWTRKKVNFNQLDKNVQKAVEAFAKTKEGNAFLGQFAKEGDKVGSVEFSKNGEFSKHEMGFQQFETKGASYGTSGFGNDREKISFYMKINTGRDSEDQSPESYAITTGHEAFIHLDQYKDKLIKAFDKKDIKSFRDISAERKRIADDNRGGPEHDAYTQGKPEYSRMREYTSQLKKILNPAEVNKQIQKHDNVYKKSKK